MKIVIFGLTISSSWGNGHATLWRGLCKALIRSGHDIVFYERDVPYYADMRDLHELPGGRLEFYEDWQSARPRASIDLADADVAIITSYCPDSLAAGQIVLAQDRALRVFYDLDTPVTLARLEAGECVPYIAASGLGDFDLVLSYSGGRALDEFRTRLGARHVAPLYGHVDPDLHHPTPPLPHYHADLSYLGTYSDDRQQALEALLVTPAQLLPSAKVPDWRRAVPTALPVVFQYLFRPPLATGRARGLFLLLAPYSQCDPAGDGGDGAGVRPDACSKRPHAVRRSSAMSGTGWMHSSSPVRKSFWPADPPT